MRSEENLLNKPKRNYFLIVFFFFGVRGPQGNVVPKKLHDESAVLVGLVRQGLELLNGVIESLLGKLDGIVRGVHDFVVENAEVQSKTKTDGIGGEELLRHFRGSFVGNEGVVSGLLARLTRGRFSKISVVVTLHLVVKDLGLGRGRGLDKALVKDIENITANVGEFLLNLLAVFTSLDEVVLLSAAFLLLFNRGDDSERSATRADDVLVCNGEQVSFFNGELISSLGDFFHGIGHFVISLGLFGQTSHVDAILFGS